MARPRGEHEDVCAVVVTHNRIALLRRCLVALQQQRRAVDAILVVDNASTDGTAEMVRAEFPRVELHRLMRNVGGAGGFHAGLKAGHVRGHEWLWLMDDDTLAQPDALGALLAGAERAPDGRRPLLLASQVLWKDGRLHPMNAPMPRWRSRGDMAEAAAAGLLLLRTATFVSIAVRREAVERFGLPLAHYFLWADDFEYTARLLRNDPGYLVPESRVDHWTVAPHTPVSDGGDRFYFHVRNSLLLLRGSSLSTVERVDYGRYYLRSLREYLRLHGGRRTAWGLVARGIRDGLRGATR